MLDVESDMQPSVYLFFDSRKGSFVQFWNKGCKICVGERQKIVYGIDSYRWEFNIILFERVKKFCVFCLTFSFYKSDK